MADSVVFVLTALLVAVAGAAFDVPAISFEEGYSQLFGEGNLVRSPGGRSVRIMLNRYSGVVL